jgi:hypothetical protein
MKAIRFDRYGDVAAAVRYLEQGHARGKVDVTV